MKRIADNCFIIDSEYPLEYIEGNRNPLDHMAHIKKIARAMRRHEFIPPLIIANYDGHHYIVDGQHRYEAARLLWENGEGYELYIIEYVSINPFLEAIKFNNSKIDWTTITYLKGWAIQGAYNYAEFLEWMSSKEWNRKIPPYRIGLALLGVRNHQKLKDGIFSLGMSFNKANEIYNIISNSEVYPIIIYNESSAKAFYKVFGEDINLIQEFIENYHTEYLIPNSTKIKDWVNYYNLFLLKSL